MKIQAWILALALALAHGGVEAAAQGGTRSTSSVTSKGTKTSTKRAVPESSLGSAGRRALLGGKTAAGSKTTGKLEKPKVRS